MFCSEKCFSVVVILHYSIWHKFRPPGDSESVT